MGKAEKESKSGLLGRLAIILGVFVIAVGGIWGYKQYLASTVPKPDMDFVKEKAEGAPDEEPEPTGLAVLGEILSGAEPSKEVTELQEKTAEKVAFTYEEIMKMTPEELDKNIKEVSGQLKTMRAELPPSIGGATAGGSSEPPKDDGTEPPNANGEEKTVTISSLALPLEVMKQIAEGRK
jgi:hypothetical protein